MTVGPDSFRPTYSSSELGLTSKDLPTDTSTSTVSALKSTLDTVGKDGKFTLDEVMQLKIATSMAICDPQLPPGDKAKLQAFYGTLTDAANHIFHDLSTKNVANPSPADAQALNDYMMVNCVLDLFQNTNELSKLYTQMMRAESKLGQKLGMVFIQMAKDVFNTTIASGELEAKNLLADASLKSLEAVSHGLKAGVTGLSQLGQKLAERSALKNASQDKYAKKQAAEQAKLDKLNEGKPPEIALPKSQQKKFEKFNENLPAGEAKLTKEQWVDKQFNKDKDNRVRDGIEVVDKETWAKGEGIELNPSTSITLQRVGSEPLTFEEEAGIRNQVTQKWSAYSSIAGNAIDGSIAAAHAGTDIYKAANILEKAKTDAARGFSQSMMEMIKETMHKLDEDKSGMSQIMNKLWDAVAAQQQVSTKQWQ